MTECTQKDFEFQGLGSRRVVSDFGGGSISSDGGALLLREAERHRGWIRDLAKCFADHRDPALIEHTVEELASQRIMGVALGYEDLNDHDLLRFDPLLAVICGKLDPSGQSRRCAKDRGKALAGKSTLNRLEHGQGSSDRYKKIVCDERSVEELFLQKFLSRRRRSPKELILDMDATDNPLYGQQEGRFFHGYYDSYCYLPLYIFCGSELLCAKLNGADEDPGKAALPEIQRVIETLRRTWPKVRIVLRGDSGFAREELMDWCETHQVDYVFGFARNNRLQAMASSAMTSARRWYELIQQPARCYMELKYKTLKTWKVFRRVVAKAEWLEKGSNPRFIVTSLQAEEFPAKQLYEDLYCARGDMENRIKEQQLALFSTRTSTATLRANQLRLWLSAVAYGLMNDLRELGLQGTRFAKAQCVTIRTRLFKIGAQISITVRRILIRLPKACPYQDVFAQAIANLRTSAP